MYSDLSSTEKERRAMRADLELRELESKPTQQFQSQMGKVAAFSGGALVFSGTILSAFKAPLVAQSALLMFYAFGTFAVLLSGSAMVLGRSRALYRVTTLLASFAIYAVLGSVLSLAFFAYINFSNDWREIPSIENITVEKGRIGVNEVVNLQADVKNPNNIRLEYTWRADVGDFLDNEGGKVTWKAPGSSGIAEIELTIAPPGEIIDGLNKKVVHIDVQKSNLSKPVERTNDFVARCTKALDHGYKGNLNKEARAYEAAAIICSSAGRADDGSTDLAETYLTKQAMKVSQAVPMHELALVVADARAKRRSFWDRRPCCNESNLLWPFCKVFSKDCEGDERR